MRKGLETHKEYCANTEIGCCTCGYEKSMTELVRARAALPLPPIALTVTTGYLIRQVYSDGSEFDVGRRNTVREARTLRDWNVAHYGNRFKIVRLYRRVRNKWR